MNEWGKQRRVALFVLVTGLAVVGWVLCMLEPQRETLRATLASASAAREKADAIDATLRNATAIRRARADVLSRLASDHRGAGQPIENVLQLLDQDAGKQGVSIVAITPGADGRTLGISVEGRFQSAMRFLAAASATGVPLEIGDVRLDAERREGNVQLLLAQIDARPYQFTMPK
jgi:hypothetical protein